LLSARRTVFAFCLFLVAVTSAGCGPQGLQYLIGMGIGELEVMCKSVPVADAIANPDMPSDQRDKLLWVGEVRIFARDVLGLNVGDSYLYYYDTGDGPAVYNLSASPKDALDPYVWQFPFVGEIQYLGYFDIEAARSYGDQLKAMGYEIVIYGAVAYSTGGIFRDPLYSSLLDLDKPLLADTVIHELTHNTIFGKDNSDYVESIASFVGKKGSLEFIKAVAGEDSDLYRQAIEDGEDRGLVNDFLARLYAELSEFYDRADLTSEEKVEQREAIFQSARERFASEVTPKFHSPDRFNTWGDIPTNNAWILLNRRYHRDVDVFEKTLESCGGSLPQAIEVFRQAGETDDPYGFLQEWLNGQSQ